MASSQTVAGSQPAWLGFAVAGVGAAVIATMMLSPEGLQVPYWVAVTAASAFVFAGLSIIAHGRGWTWLNALANLLVIACLAVPGFWIMLDPGPKACVGGFSFGGGVEVAGGASAPDWQCRMVFGAGAIVTALCGVALVVAAVRRFLGRRGTLR